MQTVAWTDVDERIASDDQCDYVCLAIVHPIRVSEARLGNSKYHRKQSFVSAGRIAESCSHCFIVDSKSGKTRKCSLFNKISDEWKREDDCVCKEDATETLRILENPYPDPASRMSRPSRGRDILEKFRKRRKVYDRIQKPCSLVIPRLKAPIKSLIYELGTDQRNLLVVISVHSANVHIHICIHICTYVVHRAAAVSFADRFVSQKLRLSLWRDHKFSVVLLFTDNERIFAAAEESCEGTELCCAKFSFSKHTTEGDCSRYLFYQKNCGRNIWRCATEYKRAVEIFASVSLDYIGELIYNPSGNSKNEASTSWENCPRA